MSKLLSQVPSNDVLHSIILSLIIFSPILQGTLIPARTFLSYQETLSEGLSLNEAFTARKFEPFTEIIALAETISVNVYRLYSRDLSDTIVVSEELETIINRLNKMSLSEDISVEEAFLARKCPLLLIDLLISDELETIINRLYQLDLAEGISVEEIFLLRKYPLIPIDLMISDSLETVIDRSLKRSLDREREPVERTLESSYGDDILTLRETIGVVIMRAIHKPVSERVEVDEALSSSVTEASADEGIKMNQLIRMTITSLAVLTGIFGFILITKSIRGR